MLTIILRRLLLSIPLLFVVSLLTFILASFLPGDPAIVLLGVSATPEQLEAMREQLHLNDPLLTQYWTYLQGAVQGDLGRSIFSNEPVLASIGQRLPVSLSLLIAATVVSALVGTALGVYSATRKGRIARGLVDVISLVGNALPNFWVGLMLVAIFAVGLSLFPTTGYVRFEDSPSGWLSSIVLPVIALSFSGVALVSKVARDAMLTTLQLDYIRTLRASGLSRRSIVWKHALRNSGISVATIVGLTLVSFISGTILVENVFALPGLGTLIVSATSRHDIPVVQGITLTFTVIVIVTNILVEIAYGLLNPKVRSR